MMTAPPMAISGSAGSTSATDCDSKGSSSPTP